MGSLKEKNLKEIEIEAEERFILIIKHKGVIIAQQLIYPYEISYNPVTEDSSVKLVATQLSKTVYKKNGK